MRSFWERIFVKDQSTLVAAYQDNEGVTSAFNLNILNRLNKEFDADFDLTGFRRILSSHALNFLGPLQTYLKGR
jgi:uncharacterized SAM-dependent methyltransferase